MTLFTDYPSQVIGIGEGVSLSLKLKINPQAQVINLTTEGAPGG